MYSNFVKLFPEAGELVGHLLDNRVYFQTVLEQEMDQDGSGNVTATINSAVTSIDPHVSDQASRAARAGEGKTFTEREGVKAATRARFRALVEKHEFSKLGDAFDKVAKQPTFRALMENSNSSTNGTNEPLPPLPRFSSESLPDLTSIEKLAANVTRRGRGGSKGRRTRRGRLSEETPNEINQAGRGEGVSDIYKLSVFTWIGLTFRVQSSTFNARTLQLYKNRNPSISLSP